MSDLVWSRDLKSGDARIDAHNEGWLLLLNALFRTSAPCPGQADTCRKIEQAVSFLTASFAREEALMRATHYGERRIHKDEHRALLCELQSMKRMYECGRYDAGQMLERLTRWTGKHIEKWDKPLGQHLRQAEPAATTSERQTQRRRFMGAREPGDV